MRSKSDVSALKYARSFERLQLRTSVFNTRVTLRYTYSSRGASSSAEIISTNQLDSKTVVILRAFVVFSNGKNGTIGRQIPFKVLPMVPLVMPLVPMVPMLPTYGSKWCRQNTAWVILPTREKSRDSIWRA